MNDSAKKFWHAVDDDDMARVKQLVEQSPELVRKRYFGVAWKPEEIEGFEFSNTALHTAAVNSRVPLAKLLIKFGADINAIGYEENKVSLRRSFSPPGRDRSKCSGYCSTRELI